MTTPTALSQLFEAERAVRPAAEVAQRGLSRLLVDLAAPAHLPAAASVAKIGWAAVSKWLAAGFAVGLGSSGIAATLTAPSHRSPSVPMPALSAVEVSAPVVAPRAVSLPGPELAPWPSATPATPSARRSHASSRTPSAASASVPARETFDAELRLINAAKAELDRGRPQLAKAWLDEHAARYPIGVFTADREALRVLTACAQHRDPLLAFRFSETHPSSPLRERLIRACDPASDSK
jgi:hypothetical protein